MVTTATLCLQEEHGWVTHQGSMSWIRDMGMVSWSVVMEMIRSRYPYVDPDSYTRSLEYRCTEKPTRK